MTTAKIHIFWDNSNIYISAQRYADEHEGIGVKAAIRIVFDSMFRLALAGRTLAGGVAVGSIPPEHAELWKRFLQNTKLNLELYERGEISGKEQGVDQCIQTHMLRALADEKEPQIAVLLTGDGKGYDDGVGFHADLERMYRKGWGIEVISWDLACKATLKKWATSVGTYISLEKYYNSITFAEGGRAATPLSLTSRAKSTIGGSPEYQAEQKKILADGKTKQQLDEMRKKNAELELRLASTIAAKEIAEKKVKGKDKYLKRHNPKASQKK